MFSEKKAVYYICTSKEKNGLVSNTVWNILSESGLLKKSGIFFSGLEVMVHKDNKNNTYYFVPTEIPICLNYTKYLPDMNKYFSDCDIAGMVTWHEGANAPPNVLTVHSIGDVNAGVYGAAAPEYMRNILLGLEKNRIAFGLDNYKTLTEATHWSGTFVKGNSPELILQYPVPIVDIEVGSIESSWTNLTACTALANALTDVFADNTKHIHNLLCVGGIHFEPSFAQAVFTDWDDEAFGISHIIANQWLVSGQYEKAFGIDFMISAIEAIKGGIEGIAFHDKLKACYKDLVRLLGKKYNVPVFKHQELRQKYVRKL